MHKRWVVMGLSVWLASVVSGLAGAGGAAAPVQGRVIWAVVLLTLAAGLFLVEVVVPAGGAVGFFGAVSLIGGIVMLFRVSTEAGLIGSIATLIAAPFLFVLALKLWPHTPIVRMLTLKTQGGRAAGRDVAGGRTGGGGGPGGYRASGGFDGQGVDGPEAGGDVPDRG